MISIHAPREGSDEANLPQLMDTGLFLSTLPARGATLDRLAQVGDAANFYPRSPRGERRVDHPPAAVQPLISIHAPREGSDLQVDELTAGVDISIHAPREGSDGAMSKKLVTSPYY